MLTERFTINTEHKFGNSVIAGVQAEHQLLTEVSSFITEERMAGIVDHRRVRLAPFEYGSDLWIFAACERIWVDSCLESRPALLLNPFHDGHRSFSSKGLSRISH
jgi:hypothetical protein